MATPNTRAAYPANDDTFVTKFLPSTGRARFVRAAILCFLAVGTLSWIVIAARVFSEFHARQSWPVAQGYVTDVRVKSFTGPSTKDHVSHYFLEYTVRFTVPEKDCLTGRTYVIEGKPPQCEGVARTRTTNSQALANSWGERHRFNAEVGVLHDPNGPIVKILGEPASLVYPWGDISLMSAWMTLFSVFLIITQRRLRYLEMLPDSYDDSPPAKSSPTRDDNVIDLELS